MDPSLVELLRRNRERVGERIAAACSRAGRRPEDVRLIAVTKSVSMPVIRALIASGQQVLGENRPQQLLQRAAECEADPSTPPVEWHLIGQLQRNKVRAVLPQVSMIHSVDSDRLLTRISEIAREESLRRRLLLQVNISGEVSKGGFAPDELSNDWERLSATPGVEIAGLMTMAPLTENQQLVRSTFDGLRALREELQQQNPNCPLPELSMGMSGDFEIAVECGATMVRVGSLLFEGLSDES